MVRKMRERPSLRNREKREIFIEEEGLYKRKKAKNVEKEGWKK